MLNNSAADIDLFKAALTALQRFLNLLTANLDAVRPEAGGGRGDAVAFLSSSGDVYSPFIGISNGIYALIAGFVFIIFKNRSLFVKILLSFGIAYIVCTMLITSLGIYILFGSKYTFLVYMGKRFIFQTPVSIANAVLGYIVIKAISGIKMFRLNVS